MSNEIFTTIYVQMFVFILFLFSFNSVGVNAINKSFVMETRIRCFLLPGTTLLRIGIIRFGIRFSIFTSHFEHKIQYIGCVSDDVDDDVNDNV